MRSYYLKKHPRFRLKMLFITLLTVMFVFDFPLLDIPTFQPIKNAEAVVGRPASPHSVAGVHRRVRRRTVRRIALGTRVHVLPVGCTTVIRGGVRYHFCDEYYYRPYYEGNTVVYVVVEEP